MCQNGNQVSTCAINKNTKGGKERTPEHMCTWKTKSERKQKLSSRFAVVLLFWDFLVTLRTRRHLMTWGFDWKKGTIGVWCWTLEPSENQMLDNFLQIRERGRILFSFVRVFVLTHPELYKKKRGKLGCKNSAAEVIKMDAFCSWHHQSKPLTFDGRGVFWYLLKPAAPVEHAGAKVRSMEDD